MKTLLLIAWLFISSGCVTTDTSVDSQLVSELNQQSSDQKKQFEVFLDMLAPITEPNLREKRERILDQIEAQLLTLTMATATTTRKIYGIPQLTDTQKSNIRGKFKEANQDLDAARSQRDILASPAFIQRWIDLTIQNKLELSTL